MADDDEDRWLYGDSSETGENKESDKDTSMKTDDEDKAPEAVKAEEASKLPPSTETSPKTTKAPADVAPPGTDSAPPQDGTADDDDSDDDSEDDDVQITIGDIKSGPPAFPPYGAMKISAYRKTNTAPSSSNTSVTVLPPKPEKTLDLEAEGTINGVGVYSFDLDTSQEKPWNKPGADITDYFNYGLNEETWKTYSEKQRKLRMEHKITVHHAGSKDSTVPPGEESVKSIPPSSAPSSWNDRHKKPFVRNQNQQGSGAISVIGSSISTISGRRDNDGGIKFNGVAVVSSSGISTVQTGTPLVSLQRPAPSTIPTMHSGPPPGSIPVMQMSQPPPNMGQPPPRFAGPPIQQAPTYHSGPPQAPFMSMPMNRPPPIMNRPPPPAFNNSMLPPPMGGMNIGPPPTGIPPPNSVPSRLPPPISSAPPRMPGPPPPQQGDNWNRPPFFPNANAPHFTPRTPVTPMRAPTPGHGPGPSPSPGPGPGPPGGPQWDRPVAGFPSFQDQWSPRAGSEESDISSGSEDYKRSPKGVNPVRGPGADERRDYRSREGERPRDRERRGRYSKDSSRERDKKHRERSHDKERDRKSRDKEDRHRKRKDRDEERSDGHRSSRHKRSKHSHRDSEKEDRSSSHGRDEMGKDLVIADSI